MGGVAQRRRIRLSVPKGSFLSEEGLVRDRIVPWVMNERLRTLRRGGARTATERQSDVTHRNYGIPVYDRQTAQAHLAELMERGKGTKP
jgi:hypothetical protein